MANSAQPSVTSALRSVLHIAKMTGVAGMENHLLTLLPGLKAKGLDVRLLILVEPDCPMDAYAARLSALGVPTTQTPIQRDLDLGLFRRLRRLFSENSYDAIHTHLIHADVHAIPAARRAQINKIFTTGHNDDPFRRRLPIRLLQRWLWAQVSQGIAISDAIRTFQIAQEGAPATRIETIHYGLDAASLRVGEGARAVTRNELGIPMQAAVVGSVCRLVEQKGISDALRAFWQVSREVPEAHYVVVGEGPLRASLQAETEGYGLGHRVHFLGWRDDARTLMTAFDALVIPSHWEGFGLVALEAMAVKLPVIATRVSALPEIVLNGQTGYLTAPGDNNALAQAMLDVFMYPTQAHALGEAGRQRLETEFSAERMIDHTFRVYTSA